MEDTRLLFFASLAMTHFGIFCEIIILDGFVKSLPPGRDPPWTGIAPALSVWRTVRWPLGHLNPWTLIFTAPEPSGDEG